MSKYNNKLYQQIIHKLLESVVTATYIADLTRQKIYSADIYTSNLLLIVYKKNLYGNLSIEGDRLPLQEEEIRKMGA